MFDSGEPLANKVARLHALAAEVAAEVDAELDGHTAADLLAEGMAAGSQVELFTTLLTERVDRSGAWRDGGARSTSAYLRNAFGLTDEQAASQVHLARKLVDHLPATRAARGRGELGKTQAQIIATAVKNLDDDLVGPTEQTLAEAAPKVTVADLRGLAKLLRQQAAPEDSAAKAEKDFHNQYVNLAKTFDGQYDLRGRLDGEHGAIVKQALDAIINRTRRTGTDTAHPLDRPSAGLRRALALVEMARTYADHTESCTSTGSGGRATIVITIDHDTLRTGYGAGDIASHGVLSAAAIRRLACDATTVSKILGRDGQTLDYGRRTRTISTALYTYLAAGDGGCTQPGCDAPAAACEAHHKIPWLEGGETNPSNLPLLCLYHHHQHHEGGWRITGDAEAELWFHPPDGSPPLRGQRHGIIPRAPELLGL